MNKTSMLLEYSVCFGSDEFESLSALLSHISSPNLIFHHSATIQHLHYDLSMLPMNTTRLSCYMVT